MALFTRAELRLAGFCVTTSFALAISGVVVAAAASEDDELEEVQVTGTRIQAPGVTSANPVDSITGDQMRQLGIVNVADALLQLVPQNVSTYSPFVTGDDQFETNGFQVAGGGLDRSSYFLGNTIANLRGLDPTFGTRTLTMVDGRRVVSTSNQADVVDLNIIPSNLLQRMDVVTGGASATYGSGAMAGVVNLVLNNRLTGFNLDMDYGINEAGDGSSPHISASGGMPLFGGKGHVLIGAEWQDQSSIQDCAAARDWCRESRFQLTNGAGNNVTALLSPLPGFEGFPGRFEMNNVRYSQFAPGGTIYHNSTNNTVGYRFELDPLTNLVGVEEYSYGYRGGAGTANVMNGDGPLVTSGQVLRAGNNRKTVFSNFEYNITERTTAYVQGNYAKTHAVNKNAYTRGDYCVRFDGQGSTGTNADPGSVWIYSTTNAVTVVTTGQPYAGLTRTAQLGTITTAVQTFLGLPATGNTYPGNGFMPNGSGGFMPIPSGVTGANARGYAFPFWIPYGLAPAGPAFNFNNNAVGTWVRVAFVDYSPGGTINNPTLPNDFWLLESITLTAAYDAGTTTILPARGRNEYAFLNTLTAEAQDRLQRSYVTGTTGGAAVGGGAGVDTLFGASPCSGFTPVRKVWNPQFNRMTEQTSETMRVLAGVKGRFGRDWRWDAYYQWGKTESVSMQNNVDTRIRLAFAMDAVIDDRLNINGVPNPNFGKPVCRVERDGIPVLDGNGRPLSDPEGLLALTQGCAPLNVFGTSFQSPEAAALQQEALDYAFVDSNSEGSSSLQTLSFSTNGTLWQGWGAGPMTGAFSLEMRKNAVNNAGTIAPFYLRSDLQSVWQDGFAGSTTTSEGSVEVNLPLVSGVPGVNLWSVNSAVRYTSDKNKGGAGTTGQTTTKNTVNWKFQTVFEPFDWMRLRLSRSRDLRAPGYRDLFTFQPGIPDQLTGNNPWRERTAASTENQSERWGQVAVGNINLKPETSNTLTLGLVLSPSGWAQGMRFTADYYNIQVRDGIAVPFSGGTPMTACWEGSGNLPDQYVDGGIALDENGEPFGRNGLFDYDYQAPDGGFPCQELTFAETTADDPDAIQIPNRPGYYTLSDIVSYNSRRPQNSLPYQRRGIDFSMSYMFPLSRAFEELPGNLSLTIRATRALESSGIQLLTGSAIQPVTGIGGATNTAAGCQPPNRWEPATNSCYVYVDLTGQIRSGTFVPGVSASPLWTGNIVATYLVGDVTASLSARYIGGARLDKTWCDADQSAAGFCNTYQNAQGQFLNGSVDSNWVKPYLNYSLNGSYNLKVGDMKQFQVFGSINNLFDKSPPYTGGGISGASAQYHDTMGRAYRMGVRLKF
jgi:outer membrane receptor protein involved in Fe transport